MDVYWKIIDFLVNLIDTMIMFKYIGATIDARFSSRRKWIWIALISIISFLILDIDDGIFYKVIVYIIILLFIHLLFAGKILRKILGWLYLLVILAAIENIVAVVLMTLLNNPVAIFAENTPYRLLGIVISKLVCYLFVTGYAIKKEKKLLEVKLKASFLTLVIGFFMIIVAIMSLIFKIYETTKINDLYVNLLVLSSAIVCILAVGIYEGMFKQAREQMDLNLLNQQKELHFIYANAVETSIEEMKRVKHDFANHLMCIMGYLELGKYNDLENYVKKLSNPIEKSNDIIVVGHPVISSLIYSKGLMAKKENIKISLETSFETSINIEDIDLCVLVGNVLDNAIEACMKCEETHREITISIQTKSKYFLFDCKNTMNMSTIIKEDHLFKTNKLDKNIHGIGLKNIHSIVSKYEGDIALDTKEDFFVTKITLLNQHRK